MNEQEQDRFEAELRRRRPAQPEEDFLRRLVAAKPHCRPLPAASWQPVRAPWWRPLLRWLVPAAVVVSAVGLGWRAYVKSNFAPRGNVAAGAVPSLRADDVQVQRDLVNSFDAVARLPGGEPVRFRCRQWVDNVTWRDKSRGLVVEQRAPRVEVVPVRFETY